MSARIDKLEALLARVRSRAEQPRPLDEVSEANGASVPQLELDEPGESVPPPAATSSAVAATQSAPPASVEELEIDDLELDEPPEESGPAVADLQNDLDEPGPPLTPPPESGEEPANPQIPKIDGPTPEQIGATISLEESRAESAPLELDQPAASSASPSSAPGELEAEFPQRAQESAERSAESTMSDLKRIRLGEETPLEARVSSRPIASTSVVDFISAAKGFTPRSFLELLDASLSLK